MAEARPPAPAPARAPGPPSARAPAGLLSRGAGQDETGQGGATDLRLLLPALTGWAVLVGMLPRGPTATGLAGGILLLLAFLGAAAGDRHRRLRGWGGLLVLSLAAAGLLCGSASLHLARAAVGPVPGWAEERAVTRVELVITAGPRLVTRGDERPSLVVLEATVVEAAARGSSARVSTPVLVLAPADQGWEQVRWRSRVAAAGRWGPADPGERTLAVLTPRGPPQLVAGPSVLLRTADHVRDRFREALAPLPPDARGLVPGLVIGDTSLTPPDLTEAMRATGMTHLSAVSGSNVAIVMGGVAVLLARVGAPRRWRTPLVLAALGAFILLCRPEPSVLRAGVMGSVGLLALTSGRRRASLPALAAAVVVLLCVDPWLATSYGFALSTLATLGLVLWARPWGEGMARLLPARLGIVGRAAAIPLAAQVVCGPVIVLIQGSITTVAVVANLLAAPLVAPTTLLGVVAACIAPVSVEGSRVVCWLAAGPAWLLGQIARWAARLPYGTVEWVDGPAGAWLLLAATLVVLLTGPWWVTRLRRSPVWSAALAGALLTWCWPTPSLRAWPPPGWVAVGCDVGQGDAVVIPTDEGGAVVVDVGPDPPALSRCLRDLGITRVDLLVLTHFHADHVAGLPGLLGQVPVDQAWTTAVRDPPQAADRALAALAAAGAQVHEVTAGRRVDVRGVAVEVLGPGARPVQGGSPANNASVVLEVNSGGTRMLLTGDVEPEAARAVRDVVVGRDYDVLKVAHHGSAAQDEELVRGARAEVAIIGVGADNTFGHPAPSTLSLLRSTGTLVLRTDLDGDVAVLRDDDGRLLVQRRGG